MSDEIDRRAFLANAWKTGLGLIGVAGAWTSWDLLQPLPGTGFGGKVRTVPADSVPETGVVEVRAARAFLTRINGEVVAISEKCTHLGCRTPYCASSNQFECPCHGSVFNRAGEYREGPAPRGMDRYPIEIDETGIIYIDTSQRIDGAPPGGESIDEPKAGPTCTSEGGH
ncbi:MAG: ubiquinol-cytochrome c reductase iron-sulfur subunit [Acidimicrobiia bacterium]|nr:ubiquinol-cytochrome c reductase iron-sulfur subunit [Acidimicrobiia bacterium]